MSLKKPTLICLTGPTAVGKSHLAIELTQHLPCEIISVDSAMVYRGMDIGTAKPDAQTLAQIPHHLINIRDPAQPYSAGDFFRDAQIKIQGILQKKRIPLLVGGTMLYFYTLQKGLADLPHYSEHPDYTTIRQTLEQTDALTLYQQLKRYDPASASRIHANDSQRIQRALLVYHVTGKPLSYLQTTLQRELPYHLLWIGLYPPNRTQLRETIAKRFELMLREGLVEEVEKLYQRGDLSSELPACRAVGYRQIWQYLSKQIDYETMKTQSIIATQQLAKRQFTWLRKWPNIERFTIEGPNSFETVKAFIVGVFK